MINFLTLPRELRDQIYDLALIASSSIVAWSGEFKSTYPPEFNDPDYNGELTITRNCIVDHQATVSSIQDLALSLLRCNSTVAREAAITFYGKNTFGFLGDHHWDPIVSWLQTIGPRNRDHLTKLEVRAQRPAHSYQQRDGTRTKVRDCHEELYPRSPFLYRSPESTEEGIVDNLNHPAIETMFAILASDPGAPKLTLTLQLDHDLLPGVQLGIFEQHPYANWFSMDLPNLMEKLRGDYAADPRRSRHVEVIWKGEGIRHEFVWQRDLIQARGWEIVEAIEVEKRRVNAFLQAEYGSKLTMRFTLKSKALTGPPVAADPSPYSWLG